VDGAPFVCTLIFPCVSIVFDRSRYRSVSYRMFHAPVLPVDDGGCSHSVVSHARQQILRLVLNDAATHAYLKKIVVSSLVVDLKVGQRMKGWFDVALVSLLEEGLLERCGSGNWARYSVPEGMAVKAQAAAYMGFEGECEDVLQYQRDRSSERVTLSPLRVSGGRGMKKRKRRSFSSFMPMSP
jgi:hypothetical protein